MNSKIFISIISFSALAIVACSSQPTATMKREPQTSHMEEKIKSLQNESLIPGLQARITESGKSVFDYSNGVRAEGQSVPVTSQDQWHIGSCTKPMTAFLIGRLIDEGKLQWTTPLSEIVPKNYNLAAGVGAITIEQLLSHSAGLIEVTAPQGGKLWPTLYTDKAKPAVMREKLVRGILSSPLVFPAGTKTEYSNSAYVVLGWIIEQIRKDTWESVMRKEMFQPLGMNSCGFGPAGIESKNVATQPWSHQFKDEKLQALPPGLTADNPPALGPAGTVHCSVDDWHKFLGLLIDDQAVQTKFLTQATYTKLTSVGREAPYTLSSLARVEAPWTKGPLFTMEGSNTYNHAIVAVAPGLKRIYSVNTNASYPREEAAVMKVLKLLIEVK